MTPETFEKLSKGTDQNARVFRTLVNGKDDNEGWVSLPDLGDAADSRNISKRVSDLRLIYGLTVENKIIKAKGNPKKFSFYRIVEPQGVLKL